MALSLTINSNTLRYVRIILGVLSAISGLIFLCQSTFFKLQFDDTQSSEILFFGILSALLVFLVFMAPNWSDVLRKVWSLNFSAQLVVDCVFMGIVWMLSFLIKYPRFDVHSNYRKSCVFEEQGKEMSRGSQYTLFSVGSFALLALLLSSQRQKILELGFFSVLVGLIMDTSMEIPTTRDGPNAWYILGSVVYCVGLILFKHYIESSMENGDDYIVLPDGIKRYKKGSFREVHRNCFIFCSALVGIVCLFLSPFSKQQFEGSANLKGVCFITLSLFLGFSLLKGREFIDVLVMKCHDQYLVKAAVKTFLFMAVSVVIFVTKYPRFKIQSNYREACKEQNGKKLMSQRNQYDVYSTGSFSLLALIMSSGKEQPVKLGIFSFLLEMTMDTSIEIMGNDEPNFLYALFAAVYCASLILVKSYLDSLIKNKDTSVRHQGSYQDQKDISMVPNAGDRSFGDERQLIESSSRKESKNAIGDIELSIGDVNHAETESDSDGFRKEDTDSGDEPSVSAWSHMEDRTQLLTHRERQKAKRREKTKKEKKRKKRKKKEDDLWISVL